MSETRSHRCIKNLKQLCSLATTATPFRAVKTRSRTRSRVLGSEGPYVEAGEKSKRTFFVTLIEISLSLITCIESAKTENIFSAFYLFIYLFIYLLNLYTVKNSSGTIPKRKFVKS